MVYKNTKEDALVYTNRMYGPLCISLLYLLILLFYGRYFGYTTHQGGLCFCSVFKQKEGYWLSSDCIDNGVKQYRLKSQQKEWTQVKGSVPRGGRCQWSVCRNSAIWYQTLIKYIVLCCYRDVALLWKIRPWKAVKKLLTGCE